MTFIAVQCVYKRALAKHISACSRVVVVVVELTQTPEEDFSRARAARTS